MANNTKNLANAMVANSPGTSGTTLTLEAGYGDSMPAVPLFLTCTPPGQLSTMGNSEVVLVTARASDTLTIERAKKLTSAKNIQVGWVVSNSVYVETSTQVGDIITTLNTAPRPGRLFMDGGTYLKSDWPLLWQYVVDNPGYGTTTSTNFTLKDMRGTTTASKKTSGAFSGALGSVVGAETHTLTQAQIPNFTGSIGLHGGEGGSQFINGAGVFRSSIQDIRSGYRAPNGTFGDSQSFYNYINFDLNGGGQSHPIVQPTTVVSYEVIAE